MICIDIGQDKDLMSFSTKPLTEPMLDQSNHYEP